MMYERGLRLVVGLANEANDFKSRSHLFRLLYGQCLSISPCLVCSAFSVAIVAIAIHIDFHTVSFKATGTLHLYQEVQNQLPDTAHTATKARR